MIFLFVFTTAAIPATHGLVEIFSLEISGFTIQTVEILLSVILFLWAIQVSIGNFQIRLSNLAFPLIVFYIYIILSILIGIGQGYSAKWALEDSRGYWYYLSYFVIVSVFNSPEQIKRLVQWFLIGLTVYTFLALGVHVWKDSYVLKDYLFYSYAARVTSRNDILFIFAIPLIMGLLLFPISRTEKIMYCAMALLFSLQILFSQSRGLWVLLALSVSILPLVITLFSEQRTTALIKATSTILLICFIAGVVLKWISPSILAGSKASFWQSTSSRLQPFSSLGIEHAIKIRVVDYQSGFSLVKEKPIFGHGIGTYVSTPRLAQKTSYFDSVWLTLWIKTGVIGVALFMWIFIIFLRDLGYVLKRYYLIESCYAKATVLALASSALSLFLCSFNNSYLIEYQMIPIFAAFMGTLEVLANALEGQQEEHMYVKKEGQ